MAQYKSTCHCTSFELSLYDVQTTKVDRPAAGSCASLLLPSTQATVTLTFAYSGDCTLKMALKAAL